MKLPAIHSFKKICSKGLFVVILLLGFFTFYGLGVSSQTRQAATQTTWVIRANTHVTNGFQYHPAQSQKVYKEHSNAFLLFHTIYLSRFHSKQATISLKCCSATILHIPTVSICQFKTIPQSGKNNASLILG
jgi:hypothetical protein